MSRLFLRLGLLIAALAVAGTVKVGAESVDITLPSTVMFYVTDAGSSSTGTPNPSAISFSGADLISGSALRISLRADAADFTPPSGAAIPASKVTWTTSNAQGGTGFNGTLSSIGFTQVFQSVSNPISGSMDMTWTLGAPGYGIKAGNHNLTMRWKIESVVP